MNLNFVFKSYDHLRYEFGRHVSGPHGGANRAIKVEPNINGGDGYTVTLYNLDGNHPIWQNNIQMAPKQMKITEQSTNKIVLRGFGEDMMGGAFSDYGLTIHYVNDLIEKCVLHMHDRNIDIEYLKSEDKLSAQELNEEFSLKEIQAFVDKWRKEFPPNVKMAIADKTDELNSMGVRYYNQNDLANAIIYFNKAVEVMPFNDDALKNLVLCYKRTNNSRKMLEAQKKLDYLRINRLLIDD